MAKTKLSKSKNKTSNRRHSKNANITLPNVDTLPNFIPDLKSIDFSEKYKLAEKNLRIILAQLKEKSAAIFRVLQSSLNASNRKTRARNNKRNEQIFYLAVLKQLKEHLDAFYLATRRN